MPTMYGSIGSGSVPVIPSGVEVWFVVVVPGFDAWSVLEAKIRPDEQVNRAMSRTEASFRATALDIW